MNPPTVTIQSAINQYIDMVQMARSEKTASTYANALREYGVTLREHKLNPDTHSPTELTEKTLSWFIADLKTYSPATERLYLTAVSGFFDFLAGEALAEINLPRIRLLIRQRARRPGQRLPQFPKDAIEQVLNAIINQMIKGDESPAEKLRLYRDRAFLILLADTGLRVHEACKLRRGDVDWNEGRAIVIGKGNKQAVVRFSNRSLQALREYLNLRMPLDGATGRPIGALPLFARHDKGAGKHIAAISTRTGENIVTERVREILGPQAVGSITPHSFRHYFVTRVLQSSGNLKLAQELARHTNIAVTQRYAHLSDDELDRGYGEIFDERNG
jgi:integrase